MEKTTVEKASRSRKKEKKELEFIMTCLAVICGCCLLVTLLRAGLMAYRVGTEASGDLSPVWKALPDMVTLAVMSACSLIICLILFYVRRGEVFTRLNANLLIVIGELVEANGLFQMVYYMLGPGGGIQNSVYLIYILLGVSFLFIGCLFKMGVHMREEQELTV